MPFSKSVVWLSKTGINLDDHIEFKKSYSEMDIKMASILFLDGREEFEGLQLVDNPDLVRGRTIVLYEFRNRDATLEKILNHGCKVRLFDSSNSPEQILSFVDSELREQSKQRVYRSLFDLKKTEQRMLVRKSEDLEELVNQRTQNALRSNAELKMQLNSMKRINAFLKDLGRLEDLRDLIFQLTQELKSNFGVQRVYLALQNQSFKTWQVNYLVDQGYGIEKFNTADLPDLSDEELRGAIATATSRPVLRIMKSNLPSIRKTVENYLLIEEGGFGMARIDSLDIFVRATAVVLDRLVTEMELKQSRVHWEMTFANIPAPLAVINSNYEVLNSNPEFTEGPGLKCYQQFAQSENPCKGCPLFQAVSSQRSQRGEVHLGDRIFEVHSNPIQLGGHLKSNVVVNYYLETTGQLELHSQLVQSEKMSALGLLAGNIAHELNNPLTGIQSMARVLSQDFVGKPGKETMVADFKAIEDAAIRCERIISSLMDYVTPRPTSSCERVSLDELVLKTMPMLKSALRLHRVDLALNLGTCSVYVNPQLLQQVIFNLVNNAAQAMVDAGSVRISTFVEGKLAVFEIEDTGPGIAEDVRGSLFEPFFTTKKQGQGTGLGLSISRSIVEGYGGNLFLKESRRGLTVFRFEIPTLGMP